MSRARRQWICLLIYAAAALCVATTATGAGAAKRVRKAEAKSYRVDMPGANYQLGGARIAVNAPIHVVRKIVQDFGRYDHVLPGVKESRIIGRSKNATDVYLKAPIMGGLAKLWGVLRVGAPKKVGRGEVIVARYQKGNLKRWYGRWKLYPCNKNRTLLKMEAYVQLKIPLPESSVMDKMEWVARKAVTSIRDRAECECTKRRRGRRK
jgi:ribosome-associated toxin RatA of RatAB toxin-antitoxin module